MTNLIKKLEVKFPELKALNVSCAYVEFGELYMMSEYEVEMELYNECEKFATK